MPEESDSKVWLCDHMHHIHQSPDPRFALTENISPVYCMVHQTVTPVVHVDHPEYILHHITQCDATSCFSEEAYICRGQDSSVA